MAVTGAEWDPIEESFITFLPQKNAFCYARSSISAPPPPAVAEFLTVSRVPSGVSWQVEPLIDPNRFARLKSTDRALWVKLVADASTTPASKDTLWRSVRSMRRLGQGLTVEIKVSASQTDVKTQQALWEEAERLRTSILDGDGGIEKATVKLPGESQPIDLVEDHLVLNVSTKLHLGATNRSLNEDLVFHLQDSHIVAQAGRIAECLKGV